MAAAAQGAQRAPGAVQKERMHRASPPALANRTARHLAPFARPRNMVWAPRGGLAPSQWQAQQADRRWPHLLPSPVREGSVRLQ
jgi:hypothetical protein